MEGASGHDGPLRGFAETIVRISEVFTGPLREALQDMRTGITAEVAEVPKLVLRLYDEAEQAKDRSLRNRCLNQFDAMLKADLGASRGLLHAIDQ